MKAKEINELGVPRGEPFRAVQSSLGAARAAGLDMEATRTLLRQVLAQPDAYFEHPIFGEVATALAAHTGRAAPFVEREQPAPFRQWGSDLDESSVNQMAAACRLPISVQGALMPDAHVGYGLPIGGVLATEGAVIPYAVGVDIACRMRVTVTDIPVDHLQAEKRRLSDVLQRETRFGTGAVFHKPNDHEVMEADWDVTRLTASLKAKARAQLGTSGSGNHFVEFGEFVLEQPAPELNLAPGRYLAFMSHSGSRGSGAAVADFFCKLAQAEHPELPQELARLAWLSLDSQGGQDYWAAMELMGHYAAANHEVIHRNLVRALGCRSLFSVENHHNFAWKEQHGGRELIVHRKGATPAGRGVLGVIPGSMASPAFLVRGKGEPDSLQSASHGAGRVMSRTQALKTFKWAQVKPLLDQAGVTLLSAGLDENPGVYKNIHEVMAAQSDLVETVARFEPRIVKMADAGERPED